jgi:hypothetical protein
MSHIPAFESNLALEQMPNLVLSPQEQANVIDYILSLKN